MKNTTVIERDWGFNVYEGTDKYGFISYKREDSELVRKYAKALSDKGVNLWYDYGIARGDDWPKIISEKVVGASFVALFVTRRIFQSDPVYDEFNTAKEYNVPIIPIFIEDVKNKDVANTQFALFFAKLRSANGINAFKLSVSATVDELYEFAKSKILSDNQKEIDIRKKQLQEVEAMVESVGRNSYRGNKLKECVDILYDMEKSLFFQKRLMMNLIENKKDSGRKKYFDEPVMPKKPDYINSPQYPKKPKHEFEFFYGDIGDVWENGVIWFIAFVVAVLAMIKFTLLEWRFSLRHFDYVMGFFMKFYNATIGKVVGWILIVIAAIIVWILAAIVSFMFMILLLVVLVILAYFIFNIISFPFRYLYSRWRHNKYKIKPYKKEVNELKSKYNRQVEKIDSDYKKALANYKKKQREYKNMVKKDSARVEDEKRQNDAINELVALLNDKYDETKKLLGKLYSLSKINISYCHIIPISYIREFISQNISDHLEGDDGLFQIVDGMLSYEQISCSTENIILNFNKLVDKRYRLYSELKQTNDKAQNFADDATQLIIDKISSNSSDVSVRRILNSSVVNTYITERRAEEQKYESNRLFQ